MQARPAYAAHAAAPPRIEPEYTSVAPSLYRAALGPVNVAHYLAAFERLDAMGRVLPGWNTAAALCPLGWLAFRRLWRAALVYLAALAAAALLLFTAGHQWLALPPPMLAGLALAGLLVACGLPGLYGDALLHADVRRRIDRAVASAPTLREAMDLLDRQASSRRRLAWTAALGAALVLAAAVAWALFQGNAPRTDEAKAQAPAMPPPQPPARPAERMDASPMPSSTPVADAAAVSAPQAESGSGAVPEPAVPAAVVDAAPAPPVQETLPAPVAQSVSVPPPAKRAVPPARQTQAAAQRKLYINVGLFADPANARRAHARLRQAGLPSTVQSVARADGRRLQRVRVGPFASAAQANAAAAQVRTLGLDAAAAVE